MATNFAYLTSSDGGAPTLTGEVGSLIALLDHVLDVGNATDGWEKVYTGSNKAAYRPRVGNRPYLRVLDDGSGNGHGAREAAVRCFESMSDVDTGNDPFPTVVQAADGTLVVRKSDTANATARAWYAIRTSRYFVLVTCWDTGGDKCVIACGDVPSLLRNDPYCTMIGARVGGSGNMSASNTFISNGPNLFFAPSSTSRAYGMRSPDGVAKSVQVGYLSPFFLSAPGIRSYPDDSGDLQFLEGTLMGESGGSGYVRGLVPNLHWTPYTGGISDGDVFASGGRNFVLLLFATQYVALETTDTGGSL